MGGPKLHHYVPRFYLERFVDETNSFWVFDKDTQNVFRSSPVKVAAETHFYRIPDYENNGIDPLYLEKRFSELEYEAFQIAECWFRQIEGSNKVIIPDVNREIMSFYIAMQLLRTSLTRELLKQFMDLVEVVNTPVDDEEMKNFHAALIHNSELTAKITQRIAQFIWIFAKNESGTRFYTSDHPVLLKTPDNRAWVRGPRVFDEGVQIIFPLSPQIILYCKERNYWKKLEVFENAVSPVPFDKEMVEHENSGQVGCCRRFVFSPSNDFQFAKDFCARQNWVVGSKRIYLTIPGKASLFPPNIGCRRRGFAAGWRRGHAHKQVCSRKFYAAPAARLNPIVGRRTWEYILRYGNHI